MKVAKSLLLGTAAVLATVAGAQAADLPTRKAAPVQYVKICDAYGAGFFYIPGTETCLRVGGLVLAQMRIQGSGDLYAMAPPTPGGAIPLLGTPFAGALPGATFFRPSYGTGRDVVGYDAVGRIELDARTQSPWGTVRSFIRLQSAFGSGLNATTGSLSSALNGGNLPQVFNTTAGPTIAKEITWIDKAFIQFAGVTMGRIQSMFDFYTDNFNYEPLRGSNQNVWGLAYTATFGGGFSATLSIEDTQSHRGNIGNAMNIGGFPVALPAMGAAGAVAPIGLGAVAAASRMPDIVANLRVDQPWGSAQLAAALHPVRAALYPAAATNFGPILGATTAYAYPYAQSNSFGFALQGGLKFNLDQIAPGDQLWLQATYAKGAIGYVNGNDMAFFSGVNGTANYGVGLLRLSNAYGWTVQPDFDCVFTYSGACEKSSAWAITAAFKHYWTSTVSSGLFGSVYRVSYTNNSTTPVSPFNLVPSVGMTNFTEFRLGTNIVWTPIRGFDIGGELMWMRGVTSRPFGLASDAVLASRLLPAFKSTTDAFYGKIRMLRAF